MAQRANYTEPSEEDFKILPRESLAMRLTMESRYTESFDPQNIKKKLKVLKDALIKERESNQQNQQKIKEQLLKIEQQNSEIDTKDNQITELTRKNTKLTVDLQEEIDQKRRLKMNLNEDEERKNRSGQQQQQQQQQIQRKQSAENEGDKIEINGGKVIESLSNFFGFGYPNQQLKSEAYKQMVQRVEECERMSSQFALEKEKLESQVKEYRYNIEEIRQERENLYKEYQQLTKKKDAEVEEMKNQLKQAVAQQEATEKRNKVIKQEFEQFKKDNFKQGQSLEHLQSEIQATQIKMKYLNTANEELKSQIESKDKQIAKLTLEINAFTKENAEQQQQQQQQQHLEQAAKPKDFLYFELQKSGSVASQQAQLLMKKNVEGMYVVEIETKQEKLLINAGELDIQTDPSTFTLVQRVPGSKVHHTFECKDAAIKKQIQDFIFSAPISKHTEGKKEQKGLLNGFYSLMKN